MMQKSQKVAGAAYFFYKYYQKNYNIEVPNLIGETYEGARYKLAKKDLRIEKKEKKVDSEDENGIVIKQSKNEGTRVKKNTKIKVIKIINNKELIVIKYRGEVMSITLDIAHMIEVYDNSNR